MSAKGWRMRKLETKLFDVASFITGGVDIEEIASQPSRRLQVGFWHTKVPQSLPSLILSSPWRVYDDECGGGNILG